MLYITMFRIHMDHKRYGYVEMYSASSSFCARMDVWMVGIDVVATGGQLNHSLFYNHNGISK